MNERRLRSESECVVRHTQEVAGDEHNSDGADPTPVMGDEPSVRAPAGQGESATPNPGRRRGRPPATDSADTRRAILTAARVLFAERGYGAVRNKDVATAAGVTPGALYHYVESKLDLYAAVDRDMQRMVYDRFQTAVDSNDTFLGKLTAVLEAAHEMGMEDPSYAGFVGAVRTDARRYPEIDERVSRYNEARDLFFTNLVDVGVATGEICAEDRPEMAEFVRAVLIGLTETGGMTPDRRRRAIDAVTGLLRGTIFTPVGDAGRAPAVSTAETA